MLIDLVLVGAVMVALLFPRTPVGRSLRDWLIEKPAKALSALTPTRIAIIFVVFAALAFVLAVAKAEGAVVLAQAIPDGAMWLLAFDGAAYIDLIALSWLLAASVRFRSAFVVVSALLRRASHGIGRVLLPRIGARRRRVRPPRKPGSTGSDGDHPAPWGGAAWA